jgi:hypothetical protein
MPPRQISMYGEMSQICSLPQLSKKSTGEMFTLVQKQIIFLFVWGLVTV